MSERPDPDDVKPLPGEDLPLPDEEDDETDDRGLPDDQKPII